MPFLPYQPYHGFQLRGFIKYIFIGSSGDVRGKVLPCKC